MDSWDVPSQPAAPTSCDACKLGVCSVDTTRSTRSAQTQALPAAQNPVLAEKRFRKRYTKAPSFLSMHLGIKADVLPKDCDCHHIIVEVGWQGGRKARWSPRTFKTT